MINYNEFIKNILDTRGRFNCGNEYCERHHILPKCVGGDDNVDNLIDLYAREHFIAHKLLAEENPENQKIIFAWWRMCNRGDASKITYQMSPEEYEAARVEFAKTASQRMSGENNPNYGKSTWLKGGHQSEETKRKLSESHKGKPLSEETRKKMSEKRLGKTMSQETRNKLSKSVKASWTIERRENHSGEGNPMYGKTHTEETREKIGLANKILWTDDRRKKQSEISSKMNSGENHPMWEKHHTEETRKKMSDGHKGAKNHSAKQVVRLIDEKIYACGKDAAAENQINYSTFTSQCRKHKDFMYYDEWITKQNEYNKETN